MKMKEKIEEMLRELDDYPEEEIKDAIELNINDWSNCTREEAIFLIAYEQALKALLSMEGVLDNGNI